jgi:hypothetical protein
MTGNGGGPPGTAMPLTLRGTAQPRLVWVWRFLWAVALFGGATVLVAVLHPVGKSDPKAIPIALFGLAIACAVPLTEFRRVMITADAGCLHLGRFGSTPFTGAMTPVGAWIWPRTGTVLGSVLHVRVNGRAVRIGARGRRIPGQAAGPPAGNVQITLSARDFDRLLAALGHPATRPSELPGP